MKIQHTVTLRWGKGWTKAQIQSGSRLLTIKLPSVGEVWQWSMGLKPGEKQKQVG